MATALEKRSAEDWARWLLEQDLPSTTDTAHQLLSELDGPARTYQAMSDEIQDDPVLALKLLAQANTALDAQDTLVRTLSHALSLLGMDFLKKVLTSVKIEHAEDSSQARRFHWRMGRSFVAAHFARQLASWRFPDRKDEIFWATLFRGIPAWYLSRMIDDRDHPPAELRGRARAIWQREHWGADEASIWQAMAPRLGLPELVTRAALPASRQSLAAWAALYRHCPGTGAPGQPEARTLRLLCQAPESLVILATWLEEEVRLSWLSRTVDKLFRIAAVITGQPLEQVVSALHEAAVEAAALHNNPGAAEPARRLIAEQRLPVVRTPAPARQAAPAQAEFDVPQTAPVAAESPTELPAESKAPAIFKAPDQAPPSTGTPSTASPAPARPDRSALQTRTRPNTSPATGARQSTSPQSAHNALRSRQGNDQLFTEITEMMFRQPHKFKDVPALMNAACQCITYGIGLKTAMIALCSNDRSRLKSYYTQGFTARKAFLNWTQPLDGNHLFARLMKTPSGIWIRPDSSAKVWDSLPDSFRDLMHTDQCFMMSVFVNQKPIALVYADDGTDGPHLTEADYARFKRVCAGLSQVLHYFAMRRKKMKSRPTNRH